MRRNRLLLSIVCLLTIVIAATVSAQENGGERWNYAIDENGDVRAFTLSGDNVVIGQVDDPYAFRFSYRVDNERLIQFEEIANNSFTLVLLSPSQIETFHFADGSRLEYSWMLLVGYAYPYFAVREVQPGYEMPVVIANIETLELTTVSQTVNGFAHAQSCCYFAKDASAFRYMGAFVSGYNQFTYQFIERDLASGRERVFYQQVFPSNLQISAHWDGSQWIAFFSDQDDVTNLLISSDGSTQTLNEGSLDDLAYELHQFYGDFRFVTQPACLSDCVVKVYSPERDMPITYRLNAPGSSLFNGVWMLPNDKFVARLDDDFILLAPDVTATRLTAYNPDVAVDQISDDGRALILIDDASDTPRIKLYDTYTERTVVTIDVERRIRMATFEAGITLSDLEGRYWFYQPQTETLVEFDARNVIDVESDGRILYYYRESDLSPIAELYVYDPATGETTHLMDTLAPLGHRTLDLLTSAPDIP